MSIIVAFCDYAYGFFWTFSSLLRFVLDKQFNMIGQYDRCEWISAKYNDRRPEGFKLFLAILMQNIDFDNFLVKWFT